MTDNWYPVDDPTAIEREPRKCKRHDWVKYPELNDDAKAMMDRWDPELGAVVTDSETLAAERPAFYYVIRCRRCGKPKDEARARRGRTSRNRGNAYEREVAAKLGGVREGQFGTKVDVRVPEWLLVQCKNGKAYPARIDGWLRSIPARSEYLRAVVIGDAPGPGGKRRSLIVLDLDEFAAWYGGER